MLGRLTRSALLLTLAPIAADAQDTHTLPIFFFHGLTANAQIASNLKANLTSDARPFVALTFCQDECSTGELNHQTDLAITQIRGIVANDTRFQNGYTFIGHSQGGAIARAVIENMDDHKVHTFLSLAGAGNGIFYGPQASDFAPAQTFLKYFAPLTPKDVYDYSNYTNADITSGKLQLDRIRFEEAHPEHQSQLTRSPDKKVWIGYNTYFPKLNNLEAPTTPAIIAEQARRKANFLKLKAAHFFGSPYDETISPWQSALLGQYNDVASFEDLEKTMSTLTIIPMAETDEYVKDTYGLKTLDARGGLFIHQVEQVAHSCWVKDVTSGRDGKTCKFQPVFEQNLYPLLSPAAVATTPVPTTTPPKPHC